MLFRSDFITQLFRHIQHMRGKENSASLLTKGMHILLEHYGSGSLGNMDSVLFLGGREASTIKEISENWLGKATISMQPEGRSRGQSESYSQNTQRPVSYTHLDVYKRQVPF